MAREVNPASDFPGSRFAARGSSALASPAPCFIDTWAWLVLANDNDPAFTAVANLRVDAAGRAGAWVTTDYILDETFTRLFAAAPFLKARRFAEAIFQAAESG